MSDDAEAVTTAPGSGRRWCRSGPPASHAGKSAFTRCSHGSRGE